MTIKQRERERKRERELTVESEHSEEVVSLEGLVEGQVENVGGGGAQFVLWGAWKNERRNEERRVKIRIELANMLP